MTLRSILARAALAVVIGGAATLLAFHRDWIDGARIAAAVGDIGIWAPLAFIGAYAVATVLFAPGLVLTLAGGALFGPVWGAVCSLTGATLGATLAFLVARYLAADWVARRAGGKLKYLADSVDAEGWRFVAFVRLVPLFPFNLLNYALGLTRIRLSHYVLASVVCMAPAALAYAWIGYAGRQALAGNEAAVRSGLLALGVLAAVAFLPRLARRLRGGSNAGWIDAADLKERLAAKSHLTVIDVRGPDEFGGPLGHIAGARNVPLPVLPARMAELDAARSDVVVLVCRTEKRSVAAAATLRNVGFRDVRVLRGGMEKWRRDGLPVENGALA